MNARILTVKSATRKIKDNITKIKNIVRHEKNCNGRPTILDSCSNIQMKNNYKTNVEYSKNKSKPEKHNDMNHYYGKNSTFFIKDVSTNLVSFKQRC